MGRKKTTNIDFEFKFLTTAEAAQFLRVKLSTIYAWIHKKDTMGFPVRHHGRKPVFLLEDLKKWSDEHS
jgi:excisionase family DNA binding protein